MLFRSNAAERITGQGLKINVGPRRDGDPTVLTACSTKFDMLAGAWRHHNLDAMIQHAWNWYVR